MNRVHDHFGRVPKQSLEKMEKIFNHASGFLLGGAPIYLWDKATSINPDPFFSQTKFHPFFLRLHYITWKCSVQHVICRSQGAEISTPGGLKKLQMKWVLGGILPK